jgi:hypothetical protein
VHLQATQPKIPPRLVIPPAPSHACIGGLTSRPMQDKRKAKSCPRGPNHLSRPPQSLLSPSPPYARKKVKRKKGKNTHEIVPQSSRAAGALMASSSLHYFVHTLVKKRDQRKSSSGALMASYLLIPPANFRIFQEIQHRTSQPFILEKIHHLEPGPTLPPALPAFPSLACDPLNPLFEGKPRHSLFHALHPPNKCPRVCFFPESHHQQASDSFFFMRTKWVPMRAG